MTRHLLHTLICVSLVAAFAAPADGTTFLVSTVSDAIAADNRCTLREAVIAANTDTAVNECPAGSGADTITLFFTSPHEISIAGQDEDEALTGDLDIRDDLTVRAANAGDVVTIDAMGLDRVFDVFDGVNLTLDGVVVQGGDVLGFGGGLFIRDGNSQVELVSSVVMNNTASTFGGGIFSRGPLLLRRSQVLGNSGSIGGGILISTSAPVTLRSSAVRNNFASNDGGGLSVRVMRAESSSITENVATRHGGGIHWRNDGNTANQDHLVNTTVAQNQAGESGGGIYYDSAGTLRLLNTTIAWNEADTDETDVGQGGGIYVSSGTVEAQNTIIASNLDFSMTTQAPECFGTIQSLGYNLVAAVESPDCVIAGTATGNLIGTLAEPIDAALNCTGNNGGPTLSVEPMAASPAIDAGDPAGCRDLVGNIFGFDQRGHARPWDGPDADSDARCDMGSVEFDAPLFDVVFRDGFESGDTSAWLQGLTRPNDPSIDDIFTAERLLAWRLQYLSNHLKGGGCDPK